MTRPSRVTRPSRASRPSWGQSSHSAAVLGDTPMEVEMGPALAGPLGSPALLDPRSISLPGISSLPGAQRGMTLVPCYLPGYLNVLADHLSRRGQILKTEWSLNQTVADRIIRAWGRPFVDLFALGKNTKLAIYVSPIREEASWKVDSLVQNWDGLYAYAYPPTSLIRVCLNKVRTENVEIVLIAPGWHNQE